MNRILIIDDDKELCTLIKRSVCAENIEADICNTGREGIQQLKEQEYQLVILDVMMPGMDGFETLEEIRKEYSLPILMFTAKNDSASKVNGTTATAMRDIGILAGHCVLWFFVYLVVSKRKRQRV